MEYGITRLTLDDPPFLPMSRDKYEEARKAKSRLLVTLGTEEKMDLLLENYIEFERELLDLALHDMVYDDIDYYSFKANVQTINRRIMNLLAAGRLYVDQVKHDLSTEYGPDTLLPRSLDNAIRRAYDNSFPYRLVEALRNHVQHCSLPVHKLTRGSSWTTSDGMPQECVFRVTPSLVVSQIATDGSFKKSVLEELRKRGQQVNLTLFLRGYVETVGGIHDELRSLTNQDVSHSEQTVRGIIRRAAESMDKRVTGLAVVKKDDRGAIVESEQMFTEMIDRCRALVQKNRVLKNLSSRCVSGSCSDP